MSLLYLIPGFTVAGLGVVLAIWALLWGRSRGRRRCPRCWYDLSATRGLRCSECGYVARNEKRLFQTKRRWRWALLGLLVLACGSSAAVTPKVKRDGWLSLVPTTALIFASPPAGEDGNHPVSEELARRNAVANLWPWQWKLVMERAHVVKTPKRWPAGTPLTACIVLPAWAPHVRLALRYEHGHSLQFTTPSFFCGNTTAEERTSYHYRTIGTPPRAGEPVRLKASILISESPSTANTTAWEGAFTLPVKIVHKADEAFEPVQDLELTRLVQEATTIRIVQWEWEPSEEKQNGLVILLDRPPDDPLEDIGVGYVVELLRDGATVGKWRMPLRLSEPAAYEPIDLPAEAWMNHAELTHWSLRVTGLSELAVCDWKRQRVWAGQFTLPLTEVLDRSGQQPFWQLGGSLYLAFHFLFEPEAVEPAEKDAQWRAQLPDENLVHQTPVARPSAPPDSDDATSLPARYDVSSATSEEALMTPAEPVAAVDYSFLQGEWTNENRNTRSYPRMRITIRDGNVVVGLWGKTHPTNTFLGDTPAHLSERNPYIFSMTRNKSFAERTFTLAVLEDGRIRLQANTHFTDRSGRPDYDTECIFARTQSHVDSPIPDSSANPGELVWDIGSNRLGRGAATVPDALPACAPK